jgi:hypothetical protein
MSVLWDGRVVTCCMDSNGVQVVGDLNKQTVQEVWTGPVLAGLRKDFGNLDYEKYPVCMSRDCGGIDGQLRPRHQVLRRQQAVRSAFTTR